MGALLQFLHFSAVVVHPRAQVPAVQEFNDRLDARSLAGATISPPVT